LSALITNFATVATAGSEGAKCTYKNQGGKPRGEGGGQKTKPLTLRCLFNLVIIFLLIGGNAFRFLEVELNASLAKGGGRGLTA